MTGVKRILLYFVMLPLLTVGGALLLQSRSEVLAGANKDVRLMRMLNEYDAAPDEGMTPEVEAFYEMGRSIDELTERVDATMLGFRHWSLIAGGMIGLALGCRLIRLSLKRTRKTYEIEPAACVACGKCFNYCPQNKSKIKYEPQNL